MTRVWVIEIKCAQNHCIAMNAFEADDEDDARQTGEAMGEEFAEMIAEGSAPDCCKLCRSTEFRVHIWGTIFSALDEAEPEVRKLHQIVLAQQQKLYTSRN